MPARSSRLPALAFLLALFALPLVLRAQAVDVIRGQVTDVDGRPIDGAIVTATAIGESALRMTRTDAHGRYLIAILDGQGAYAMKFMFLGYLPQEREVRRLGHQQVIAADAHLAPAPVRLGSVTISASPGLTPLDTTGRIDVGGTERQVERSELPAAEGGEVARMAASLPGVLPIAGEQGSPDGFSVLGLGAEQNATTLNGMRFGGTGIPRDAQVTVSLVTTPYDVSRGGFSGAQFNIRTRPGTNRTARSVSAVVDAPPLQWTDPGARAVGDEFTSASLSGNVSGPIRRDRAFYNVSYELGRRSSGLQHLFNTDVAGLQASGIAADSVARLVDLLSRDGAPTGTAGLPSSRLTDHASVFGAFDVVPGPQGGPAFNVTVTGGWSRHDPVTSLVAELPSHSGERTSWNGGAQLRHVATSGASLLSETSVAVSRSRVAALPYRALPAGRVRITSEFGDETRAVRTVAFGGNQALNATTATGRAGAMNALTWLGADGVHRVKLTSELNYEEHAVTQAPNTLGTFSFNSLEDLGERRPASFTRQLASRTRHITQLTGGMSLGHSYVPHADLQVQYGIRVDGNRFLTTPDANPRLARTVGARNEALPGDAFVSPRAGFSWTYGVRDSASRVPRPVVRGGVGVFQNASATASVGTAIDNTGLPSGIQQVECVGPAAPDPAWPDYAASGALVPTSCADGSAGTVFSSGVPNVTLFAPGFSPPRSLRGNLSWTGSVLRDRFMLTAEATYSLNGRQAGRVDVNFRDSLRFVLSEEGNRPVFVRPTSIAPSSGAVAWRDGRVTQDFARVSEVRSDLASIAKQLKLDLAPRAAGRTFSWRASYVWSDVRERSYGFASTSGDPYQRDWGRGTYHTRHQVTYSLGLRVLDLGRLTWSGALRSGRPFTPTVSADVNGDGYANDRAFVFDPIAADDSTVARGMADLLEHGAGDVGECLRRQLGGFAARNSCEGPWTASATASFAVESRKLRLPSRARVTLQLTNPLGAADLLVHGMDGLHGWGQAANPERTLLYVRGFDPARPAFRYEVNPRFGATRVGLGAPMTPVRLSITARLNLG